MVPSTLAENAGLDATLVVSQLMEKYTEDLHCGYGVEIEVRMRGGVKDRVRVSAR